MVDGHKWGQLIEGLARHDAGSDPLSFAGGKISVHQGSRFTVADADNAIKPRQSSPSIGGIDDSIEL